MGFLEDSNAVDQSDNTIVVGSGSPGSPSGGVVTIQGHPEGADVPVKDVANISGVNGSILVGTRAVAARVSAANLVNRKNLTIHNNSLVTIYWGYSNTVTTANGTPLYANQFMSMDVGPAITVYLIAGVAGNNVRVTEAS